MHVICESRSSTGWRHATGSKLPLSRPDDAPAHGDADLGIPVRAGCGAGRALIDAGITGRLYTASASTWWRRDADYYLKAPLRPTWAGALGGTVVNHTIHIHDLLTWIGGPLAELQAMTATR